MLRLEAIHFNHNTNAATGDALNIRLNHLPGTVVQSPEWRQGSDSLPVAYAREQVGAKVTVKAKLHGPPNSAFRVRARDAADITRNKTGLVKWLALLIVRLLGLDYGGVLGEIAESVVSFGPDGDAGWIELEVQRHRIKRAGVGIYHVCWLWEYLQGSDWESFVRSEHKIYVVIDQPQEPWSNAAPGQAGGEEPLAWVDALDLACDWAAGATNQDEAARLITRQLNHNPLLLYTYGSGFISAWDSYLLSSFMDHLKSGVSFRVNCDDCASAVTTLSNLLGCTLVEGDINPKYDIPTGSYSLKLRRVLAIGGNPDSSSDWQEDTWGRHQVAWLNTIGANQFVYDACLQLDLSESLGSRPSPHLATKMRFGEEQTHGYMHYFLRSDCVLDRTSARRLLQ